jgi:CRISPR system Cascade subunit CasA
MSEEEHLKDKEFNLLYEPWIPAMTLEGDIEEVSILDIYRRAHELKDLAGELPLQDTALLRLLLAPLYKVITQIDCDGNVAPLDKSKDKGTGSLEALARWKRQWDAGKLSFAPIEQYLTHYEERFYLFHPETPFYQVAGLCTQNNEVNPITQIIIDVPSRAERRFFSTRSGQTAAELTYAEAARWLVSLQAWDYAGKKASTVGGTKDGGGTGWLGKLGVVYAQGETLFETLLLNLVLLESDGNHLLDFGKPFWEEVPRTAAKVDYMPRGFVELLTWQSRRTLLFRSAGALGAKVSGVLSSYGDVFEKSNTFIEQMSGWHITKQGARADQYIPTTHSAGRSVWRDLGALLPQANEADRIPGIVSWIATLRDSKAIDLDMASFHASGVEYGAMQGVVNEVIDDRVLINAELLTSLGTDWVTHILKIIEKTDKCVFAFGILASDLSVAAGNDDDKNKRGVSEAAREHAYFLLDAPFRDWLARINPRENSISETMLDWGDRMCGILFREARVMVNESGEKALAGHSFVHNAPVAHSKFVKTINKNLKD